MNLDAPLRHLASVQPNEVERYARYLKHIIPVTNEDLFRRWLFAYASVHTTWKLNCKLYRRLAGLEWLGDADRLKQLIIDSGAGLHNNRTRYIQQFSQWFWEHPTWFWKTRCETWVAYRDRIRNAALGIGRAKSSFVIELTYPCKAQVICTDTHVMSLYGVPTKQIGAGKVLDKEELAMETHWVEACQERKLPPVICRWIYWDRKQKYADPRYWSYVFERNNFHEILGGTRG